MRIPFGTRSYKLGSLPVSAQRLVNWYPETQPQDAATPVALMPTPGLKAFATAGSGPIKGAIEFNGVGYVISGTTLYSVTIGGVATSIGSVIAADRYSMAHNGLEIMIAAGATSYTYDTTNGLRTITDADFLGADQVTYQDGYFIARVPDTAKFQISALYDGTSWDAADFATAEGDPDTLVSIISDHRELWLFGSNTTEVWQNTGAAAFPFERLTYMERGFGAEHSVAKVDNSVFWLGDDGIIYRAQNYTPIRISDHGVEQSISSMSDYSDAYAFTYANDGHTFYVIVFPTGEQCFVYDVATGVWHERSSYDKPRYRPNAYIRLGGKHIVGDYETGALYELDDETYTDAGDPILRTAISPPLGSYERPTAFGRFIAEMEMGVGLTTGQGSDPQVWLSWSDDGGHTWSNDHYASIGKKGEYSTRAVWRRLGRAYRRVWRLEMSDPVKAVFLNAYAE